MTARIERNLNRKKPVPKSKIQAPIQSLAKCNDLGVRAEIVKQNRRATNPYWIKIDDLVVYYYEDNNSLLYVEDTIYEDDIDYDAKYIGGGVFIHAHEPSHISTPWSSLMWAVPIP